MLIVYNAFLKKQNIVCQNVYIKLVLPLVIAILNLSLRW